MLSNPRVSIVMNCFNGEKYLRETVDSAYAQTYQDWEIIFLDNASTDSSAAIARSYDDRLRYFRSPETVSLGLARNLALEHCRGQFIAFLDCDDIWLSDKLTSQMPLFEDPEVGLVFSNCISFTASGTEVRQYRSASAYSTGRCFDSLLRNYFLTMSSVIIRRSCLNSLTDRFDTRLEVSEELDLFLRIAYLSKLAMIARCLVKYRVHSSSDTWRKSERFAKEAELIVDKFRQSFPDFGTRYRIEVAEFLDRVHFGYSVSCWKAGRGRNARQQLRNLHRFRLKFALTYCATFLPFALIEPLIRKYSGRLYPD